ncbi:MAG: hypothetical protein AAF465_08425 [Pseudomonadota bacterium]
MNIPTIPYPHCAVFSSRAMACSALMAGFGSVTTARPTIARFIDLNQGIEYRC